MKTQEQINKVMEDINEYLKDHYYHMYEVALEVLPAVLTSTTEEIGKYHKYLCKSIGPYYLGEDRKRLQKEQEDFYNKNLKGKSRYTKKYQELWDQYTAMDVPAYDDMRWDTYSVICWVVDDKENPAYPESMDMF